MLISKCHEERGREKTGRGDVFGVRPQNADSCEQTFKKSAPTRKQSRFGRVGAFWMQAVCL